MLQHAISKQAEADIVIIAACGERANEVVEIFTEFPELVDPHTGRKLMERTIIIANTSKMCIRDSYTRVLFYSAIYSEIPFIEVTDFKHFVGQGDGGYSLCHSWKDGSLLILLNVCLLYTSLWVVNFFYMGIKWSTCGFLYVPYE